MILRSSGAAVVLALACLWGCGSLTPAMPNPITEPVIDEPGRYLVRYRDAVVEVLVDTTFAADNLGSDWLVLNVGLSGMTASATAIDRTRVSVLTPDRRVIPLPSYREFNAAGSFVVRLPRFADAVEVLPVCDDSKHALQLLKSTRGVLESLTGTAKQTWVLHTSGSFAVYSKMSA